MLCIIQPLRGIHAPTPLWRTEVRNLLTHSRLIVSDTQWLRNIYAVDAVFREHVEAGRQEPSPPDAGA